MSSRFSPRSHTHQTSIQPADSPARVRSLVVRQNSIHQNNYITDQQLFPGAEHGLHCPSDHDLVVLHPSLGVRENNPGRKQLSCSHPFLLLLSFSYSPSLQPSISYLPSLPPSFQPPSLSFMILRLLSQSILSFFHLSFPPFLPPSFFSSIPLFLPFFPSLPRSLPPSLRPSSTHIVSVCCMIFRTFPPPLPMMVR